MDHGTVTSLIMLDEVSDSQGHQETITMFGKCQKKSHKVSPNHSVCS